MGCGGTRLEVMAKMGCLEPVRVRGGGGNMVPRYQRRVRWCVGEPFFIKYSSRLDMDSDGG